jgi:predicted enzyme related to lactoylglutathione lyase
VIGHFIDDQPVAGDAGVRLYIYVEDVQRAVERILANGGEVQRAPFAEGDLTVATFGDPAGNVLGVWQFSPRS